MGYARASLFYLASYLSLTGFAFLFWPEQSLQLLGAQHSYETAFVQFTGAFMVAVAMIVAQIIRFRLNQLHHTTVAVRVFFLAVITSLFHSTGDPLFLVILAVVALGVALTLAGFFLDRNSKTNNQRP